MIAGSQSLFAPEDRVTRPLLFVKALKRSSVEAVSTVAAVTLEPISLRHISSETNLADAILEIVGAADDFDFNAHEQDGQVAAVQLRNANGILLGGQDDFGLPFFSTIDGVQDFLLGKAVVIGEPLGINQFGAQGHEALLKAFRLGNAAERRHLSLLQQIQTVLFAGKNILEIQRMMNAFDDGGVGIEPADAFAQFARLAIALGDENRLRARQVGRRFAER